MLRDSRNKLISGVGVPPRSCCKLAAESAVRRAESYLRLKDIISSLCTGWQGLPPVEYHKCRREKRNGPGRSTAAGRGSAKAVEPATQGTGIKCDLSKKESLMSQTPEAGIFQDNLPLQAAPFHPWVTWHDKVLMVIADIMD